MTAYAAKYLYLIKGPTNIALQKQLSKIVGQEVSSNVLVRGTWPCLSLMQRLCAQMRLIMYIF